jgi:flagellar basal body-associated protein FliL
MKIWIRIVIAIAALVVAGVVIWAFCFREKDEVQAYNKASGLINYKQSLALEEQLNSLRGINYFGDDPSNLLDEDDAYVQKINYIRKITLDDQIIVQYEKTI